MPGLQQTPELGFGDSPAARRLRDPGVLDDPVDVPAGVAADLARQPCIADPGCLAQYDAGRVRWLHAAEIRKRHGYREFTDPSMRFRLARWLHALCWTGTDRPSVPFGRATAWLVTEKVLLPGASALERLISRIPARAARRLWRTLARDMTMSPLDARPQPLGGVPDHAPRRNGHVGGTAPQVGQEPSRVAPSLHDAARTRPISRHLAHAHLAHAHSGWHVGCVAGTAAHGRTGPPCLQTEDQMQRRDLTRILGAGAALSAMPAFAQPAAIAEPLKVGFVYIGPVGDFGWTYETPCVNVLGV